MKFLLPLFACFQPSRTIQKSLLSDFEKTTICQTATVLCMISSLVT